MRKVLNELPMVGLGTGVALAGSSLTVIGVLGIKKNFYGSAVCMAVGAWFTNAGVWVTIGAVERARGLR